MGKYFGTDGVAASRMANLHQNWLIKLAAAAVCVNRTSEASESSDREDTRISGPMLEAAFVAGLFRLGRMSFGLGVVTTPAVAYLTRKLGADAGVMISASHNPVEDNGIKFFGGDGFKLMDETELEIEQLLDAAVDELPRPIGGEIGTRFG